MNAQMQRPLTPGSLRARLTLAYATPTAILIGIVLCASIALATQRSVRTTALAIDAVADATRQLYHEHQNESDPQLFARINTQHLPPGVTIRVHTVRPPGIGPPNGSGFGPLGDGGIRAPWSRDVAPPAHRDGALPQGNGQPAPPRRDGPPADRTFDPSFGFHARVVFLHRGDVFIGPATPFNHLLGVATIALVGGLLAAVVVSLAVGWWITKQALEPLTTVTSELERFASGDFQPSRLDTTDQTEFGDLVAAYNGAAAQVVAAFSERERTEQHLRLFLGEAGHEMRTPLTVISAHLEMLDTDETPNELRPATLRTLRAETRRLRELVERVMALARMEGGSREGAEIVDVADVAHEAVAHVIAVQPADVRLMTASDDVIVLAQPWELQEAIGNLVDNAIRYGGGTPVEVTIDQHDGNVVIRVCDEGPGISDADRPQLFRHFFRGDRAAGTTGSGLGLAIVARAAERLGGEITLEAAQPRNTVFRLTIPAFPRTH